MITVNGHEVVPTHFPDGTQQVWKLPEYAVLNDAGLAEFNRLREKSKEVSFG